MCDGRAPRQTELGHVIELFAVWSYCVRIARVCVVFQYAQPLQSPHQQFNNVRMFDLYGHMKNACLYTLSTHVHT